LDVLKLRKNGIFQLKCDDVIGQNPYGISGNPNCRGRLSMVDLLIRVACFVKNKIMFSLSRAAILN
jgi:hypothetical protein